MIITLIYAVIAAVVVSFFGWALAKPRSLAGRWLRRAWWWIFLRVGQENDDKISKRIDVLERSMAERGDALAERMDIIERAVERIAAELAQRRCSQEGNPDDEYYSDWYRWFSGDLEANVDYSRKQTRDLARLRDGGLS